MDKVEIVFITFIRIVGYADARFGIQKMTMTLKMTTRSFVISKPGLDRLHWLLRIDLLLFVRSLKWKYSQMPK